MKVKTKLFISFIWFYCSTLIAQGIPVETAGPGDVQEQNVEEITVIGQKELYSLKMEVIRAEDLKFEIFNSLNSTDDFDITCEMLAGTGTHIKYRVCDVNFIKNARAEDAQRLLDSVLRTSGITLNTEQGDSIATGGSIDLGLIRSEQQLAVQFAPRYKALNKEMIALSVEHPELAAAIIRANELKQRYLAERRNTFKDSVLIGHPEPEENAVVISEIDIFHISFLQHKRGEMIDEIWDRWDKWYRMLLHKESYRTMWASANQKNYAKEFVHYVNTIISEE